MRSAGFRTPGSPSTTPRTGSSASSPSRPNSERSFGNGRPTGRPAFRQADLALASAKKELYWAQHRLEAAEQRLDELRPLSQARRKGRELKRSTVEQVRTFADDLGTAEAKFGRWEEAVEALRPELDERPRWDADHDWPGSRLQGVDAELAELSEPARRTTTRDASLVRPDPGGDQPAWLDRVAEIARPPFPGPDAGHGIDLGL